jgi:hypothetical protein
VEIDTAGDGTTWLWLEDVAGEADAAWPVSRYGLAAYHLGLFNGSYSGNTALPNHPWLSRNWLRGWIEEAAPFIDALAEHRDHPNVVQMYDVDHILGLWRDRHRRLDYLENLPQTLCHLDAYRGNLFSRRDPSGQEQTVAIDWAFAGHAAFGEELASLVAASVALGHVEPERMRSLRQQYSRGIWTASRIKTATSGQQRFMTPTPFPRQCGCRSAPSGSFCQYCWHRRITTVSWSNMAEHLLRSSFRDGAQ